MYEIFEELLKKNGVTAYKVAKETGITTATLTSWKQGKYTPKQEKLQKIADYFGVSLNYLSGKPDDENDSDNESEFNIDTLEYALYGEARDLNEDEKRQLLELAKLMNKKRQEYENK